MSDEFLQVVTTTSTQDEARKIAAALVENRLAACVQIIGPVESVYRWQGKIETAAEWQCWIKTRRARFEELKTAISKLHSYDVPEILALPICDGSARYLRWLADETT
ncbi:MAG TPA: divalent-cation tolerance protein CutA [Pirellulales bacterium]|jgi:periplasmic divalent cation tolerance protein